VSLFPHFLVAVVHRQPISRFDFLARFTRTASPVASRHPRRSSLGAASEQPRSSFRAARGGARAETRGAPREGLTRNTNYNASRTMPLNLLDALFRSLNSIKSGNEVCRRVPAAFLAFASARHLSFSRSRPRTLRDCRARFNSRVSSRA